MFRRLRTAILFALFFRVLQIPAAVRQVSLIAAYFFLLIAFYVVKKLSTIVLPSMYIILTYIQCLSIVGNRQGWGTIRTKYFLKSTEIVNFPLDLFIPSCADEMPFVHKAVFFTVTPIFYVLVDVVLVDIVFRWCWWISCSGGVGRK